MTQVLIVVMADLVWYQLIFFSKLKNSGNKWENKGFRNLWYKTITLTYFHICNSNSPRG